MKTKKPLSKSKANSTNKISEEDIKNRAQKIYENRVGKRIHGDANSDWIQAEKELLGVKK